MQEEPENYMHQCLSLAKIALETGNPPVGALIVLNGEVIGKGIESGKSTGDISNHAEIMAIREAVKNGYSGKLGSAQLYTTHEPCLMCSYMIRHHKIAEIVYGLSVPFVGGFTSEFGVLSTATVPKWGTAPKVTTGICLDECNALTEQFLKTLNTP